MNNAITIFIITIKTLLMYFFLFFVQLLTIFLLYFFIMLLIINYLLMISIKVKTISITILVDL